MHALKRKSVDAFDNGGVDDVWTGFRVRDWFQVRAVGPTEGDRAGVRGRPGVADTIDRGAYRRLVESIGRNLVVYCHDAISGELLFLSEGFEKVFGLPVASALGCSWPRIADWNPDDMQLGLEFSRRMSAGEIDRAKLQLRFQHGDGSEHAIAVSAQCSEIAGRVVIDGIAEDVTGRLRRERRRAQEREVMAAELELARRVADVADRAKSEFLRNISHELRTPLNGVLGLSARGRDKFDRLEEAKLRSYFAHIHTQGLRLLDLVEDLVDLARLEAGTMEYTLAHGDLAGILDQVIDSMSVALREKALGLERAAADVDTVALVDADKFAHVVRHLLANAVDFTPAGRTIRIAFADARLPGPGDRPAISLSIADEGVGIPDDELDLVFGSFVQSSRTGNGAGGSGIGLAICRKLVEHQGGTIGASNRAGGGSVFTVTLSRPPSVGPGLSG